MKEVRRLKITTTVHRIVRGQPAAIRTFCPICTCAVDTLDLAQAAAVLELDPLQFQRLLAEAVVHALPMVSGSLRVCQNSLFPQQEICDDYHNASVVNTAGAGYLTMFPANLTTAPLVATSNYTAPAAFGYNRHFIVGLSPADGKLKVLTLFTTDLIVDAAGYFAP